MTESDQQLPLLSLRDVVVYPHMVLPLFVGRERSIDALVAAASGADAKLVDAMSTGAVARLADKVTVANLQTVEATRAIRALCALAAVNQMIRNDVARLFCGVVRDAIEIGSPNAEDLVSAMCRDDDGVLTRFVSSDEAQRACADLTTFCLCLLYTSPSPRD